MFWKSPKLQSVYMFLYIFANKYNIELFLKTCLLQNYIEFYIVKYTKIRLYSHGFTHAWILIKHNAVQ